MCAAGPDGTGFALKVEDGGNRPRRGPRQPRSPAGWGSIFHSWR